MIPDDDYYPMSEDTTGLLMIPMAFVVLTLLVLLLFKVLRLS